MSFTQADIDKMVTELSPLVTTWALRIVGALVLLIVAWVVAGWVRSLVFKAFQKAQVDQTLGKFGSSTSRWLVLVVAGIAILGIFGVPTTSFAAVLGAAGLAIGLALQGSLSNVGAGAVLLMFRPFKVGDVITAAGHTGKVDEISLLSTNLDTPDNQRIIVPNSKVLGASVVNVTFHGERRIDVAVGTDYGADIDETRTILEKVVASIDGQVPGKDPAVVLVGLGASSIDWQLRIWAPTADYFGRKEELTAQTKRFLDEAKIGIPFPQMDVHLDK